MSERHPKQVRADELRNEAAIIESQNQAPEDPKHPAHNDRHRAHALGRVKHLREVADKLDAEVAEEFAAAETPRGKKPAAKSVDAD